MGPLLWIPTRGRGSEIKRGNSLLPYTKAFVAAQIALSQTLSSTEIGALNTMEGALTAAGQLAAYNAIWPFVGGTATSQSLNFINPAANQITWSGTVIHGANGITGDGSTGFGQATIPLSPTAGGISVVNKTAAPQDGSMIGNIDDFNNGAYDLTTQNTATLIQAAYGSLTGDVIFSSTPSSMAGLITVRRATGVVSNLYINGSVVASGLLTTIGTATYTYLQILNRGNNFSDPSNANLSWASQDNGTVAEATVAPIIAAFETALGR